jgi:hypothetical protein
MIKSLTALAIFALLGASVLALPGFARRLEARETIALAKGDRLDIRPVAGNCELQGVLVREARLVTARR